MPIERQRWVPAADLATLNQRMPRIIETLDKSARYDLKTVTASQTVILTYPRTLFLVDTTSGSVTLTLPPAAASVGMRFEAKKTAAANTVTIDGNASETIDGATTLAWTTRYQGFGVVSDGTRWHIV